MWQEIGIANFRGVEQGQITELAPLSVIVGGNNSGKSTVLEALWFAASRHNAGIKAQIARRRGWCGIGIAGPLFYQPKNPMATFSVITTESSYQVALQAPSIPDGDLPEDFIGLLEDAYSTATANGREQQIEDLLSRIGLKGQLRILKRGNQYGLHTVAQDRTVAVYFSGDGYKRLVYIACVLAGQLGGLVLLEEPECFQHPTHIRELAQLIWGAIEQGTQVVLSTHSLELMRHLFDEERVALDKAAVFHTRLHQGRLSAVRIPGPRARERLEDLGEDLRQ